MARTETPERVLRDRWDAEAFRVHMAHDGDHAAHADECDECFVTPMLIEIHEVWQNGSEAAAQIIWSMQDGYGEPGFMPEQGYDWSGIRDSTPATVRAIWKAIHA
jgi:hypothetical protein